MTFSTPAAVPAELLATSIIEAADRANIGLAVTRLEPGGSRSIYLSDAAVRLLGAPREELLTRPALAAIAPEERERVKAWATRPETRGQRIETVVLHADGSRLSIATVSSPVTIDGSPAVFSFFWDLSDQRAAEEARRAEADRLSRLVESAPDGILLVRGATILTINPAGARLLGFDDPAALVGRSLDDFVVPEELALMRQRMSAVMTEGHVSPQEYRMKRFDGSLGTGEVTSLLFDYQGQPAMLAFVRDVSERATMRRQLERTERLAALSTLSAAVAHEINNPLAVASLRVEALERQLQEGDVQGAIAALAELRTMHQRIAHIVRDLKAAASVDEDSREAFDLGDAARAVERLLPPALTATARLSYQLGTRLPVEANVGRIEQVFLNLLINAFQALPEGRASNEVQVKGGSENGRAWVEVCDNGIGIEPANLAQVFDPFFTTKPVGVGTGLGLAVCHNILNVFGGDIRITSEVGQGTTVRVSLPLGAAAPPLATQKRPALGAPRPRVVLIDDQPSMVATMRLLLESDHQIEGFSDAGLATRYLLAEAESIDVVVCDLMMPAIDGVSLFQNVVRERPRLASRFIFMTGACSQQTAEFLNSIKAPLIHKPFKPGELEALLAQFATR